MIYHLLTENHQVQILEAKLLQAEIDHYSAWVNNRLHFAVGEKPSEKDLEAEEGLAKVCDWLRREISSYASVPERDHGTDVLGDNR